MPDAGAVGLRLPGPDIRPFLEVEGADRKAQYSKAGTLIFWQGQVGLLTCLVRQEPELKVMRDRVASAFRMVGAVEDDCMRKSDAVWQLGVFSLPVMELADGMEMGWWDPHIAGSWPPPGSQVNANDEL